jgi:hypothetical protein
MLVKLKNTFKLNKDNYFKFKVYGTFALLITIAIFIACFLVADIIRSSRLENQYREIFFSISDNFNRVNINHLSSQNEIHQALDKLDLTNTTRSQKIKELKEIIIKLNKAKYYKRGKNRTIVEINYRVAGVQESLNCLWIWNKNIILLKRKFQNLIEKT